MRRPTPVRQLVAVGVALLLAGACTPGEDPQPSRPPLASSGPPVEVKTGPTTALQAMRRLCIPPDIPSGPVTKVPTPPAIAEVEEQVEAVRGLAFERRINVEPVTPEEIDRRLGEYLDVYYPKRFYARRSAAWATIGAIPRNVGILGAIDAYQQGQVLGFYDSQNGELVYTGDADLDRLDDLVVRCEDEPFQAALGIVEGSANHFATQVLLRFPVASTGSASGGGPAGDVPPLMLEIFAYPYSAGQRFADALADAGGPAAVDRALRTFPTTTEQILHPEKFPHEVGESIDVPDFAPTFGPGWRDHDVMVVGEMWLKALLNLRLDESASSDAAAGWDGGTYRAWTDGEDVAVVLSTAWDSAKDAREFAAALAEWGPRGSDGHLGVIGSAGTRVNAAFASSEDLLPLVSSTLGSI